MPRCKILGYLCLLTLAFNLIDHVKTQMMPEYDDYPQYPDRHEHMMPPPHDDYPMGMDEGPGGMDEGPEEGMGMGGGPDGMGMGAGGGPMGMRGRRGMGMGRGGPKMEARKNEVVIGRKRFKLYEKKRLTHKRAMEFCKKKEGKLAEAQSLEEMRRLESLFARARMIGMDVWVGHDKKQWKKHSTKNMDHPALKNLNSNDTEKAGIRAMMMGGGMKEMCPAIGLSTRSLAQVMCAQPLPFICEYDRNRPRTTRKPKGNSTTTKKGSTSKTTKQKKKKAKRKDEMK